MKKITMALIALLAMGSVFADEEFVAKDMVGTEAALETWERHGSAKFTRSGGPDDKSYITIFGPHMIMKSMNGELDKLKGRKVTLYGQIKAENVKKTPRHWEGVKFQIVYKEKGVKGARFAEGNVQRTGSYDWKEFETSAKLPQDLESFTIKIGIQGTSGRILVSDIDLKFTE